MLVHDVAAFIRPRVPDPIFSLIRRIGTALLTPMSFSYHTGHFRSAVNARALDKQGAALPWYTYSAIDFLTPKNFTGKTVLEFGAGQSTLWWADRAAEVWSFESDPAWHAELKETITPNVRLFLTTDLIEDVPDILDDRQFDFIVIDGLDRFKCAEQALGHVAPGGAILLDNAEGYGVDMKYGDNIMDLLRRHGFQRVDFYGYAPGVILPHCTSFFFKSPCWLLDGAEYPKR